MGNFIGFLLATCLVSSVQAETVVVFCESTASPTTLLINPLSFPDAQDNCDIAYEDDCGRVIGRYTLAADLSDLHTRHSGADSREFFIDTFDEANGPDLEIRDGEEFTIRFEAGFRQALQTPKGAIVSITSHAVTEEPPTVKLFCHIQ